MFNKKLQISEQVRSILSESLEFGPGTAKIVKQLDRTLYQHVNKILEALGGKWNRGQGCHVFDSQDVDGLVEDVLITGFVVDTKKSFDFFETPPKVLITLFQLSKLSNNPNQRILEPSAGKGAIAEQIRLVAPMATLQCVEFQPDNCVYLKTAGFKNVDQADFMAWEPQQSFDRIIMNPPFSKKQDIRHVARAYGMLKKGGRLVSVMSAGVEFRQECEFQNFRSLVVDAGGEITKLPDKSFAVSGTNVNTVVIVLNR